MRVVSPTLVNAPAEVRLARLRGFEDLARERLVLVVEVSDPRGRASFGLAPAVHVSNGSFQDRRALVVVQGEERALDGAVERALDELGQLLALDNSDAANASTRQVFDARRHSVARQLGLDGLVDLGARRHGGHASG
jgi:hypothetical protein